MPGKIMAFCAHPGDGLFTMGEALAGQGSSRVASLRREGRAPRGTAVKEYGELQRTASEKPVQLPGAEGSWLPYPDVPSRSTMPTTGKMPLTSNRMSACAFYPMWRGETGLGHRRASRARVPFRDSGHGAGTSPGKRPESLSPGSTWTRPPVGRHQISGFVCFFQRRGGDPGFFTGVLYGPGERQADPGLLCRAGGASPPRSSLWSEPQLIIGPIPPIFPIPNSASAITPWPNFANGCSSMVTWTSSIRPIRKPYEHHPLLYGLHRLEDLHRGQTGRGPPRPLPGRKADHARPDIVTSHAASVGLFTTPRHREG